MMSEREYSLEEVRRFLRLPPTAIAGAMFAGPEEPGDPWKDLHTAVACGRRPYGGKTKILLRCRAHGFDGFVML